MRVAEEKKRKEIERLREINEIRRGIELLEEEIAAVDEEFEDLMENEEGDGILEEVDEIADCDYEADEEDNFSLEAVDEDFVDETKVPLYDKFEDEEDDFMLKTEMKRIDALLGIEDSSVEEQDEEDTNGDHAQESMICKEHEKCNLHMFPFNFCDEQAKYDIEKCIGLYMHDEIHEDTLKTETTDALVKLDEFEEAMEQQNYAIQSKTSRDEVDKMIGYGVDEDTLWQQIMKNEENMEVGDDKGEIERFEIELKKILLEEEEENMIMEETDINVPRVVDETYESQTDFSNVAFSNEHADELMTAMEAAISHKVMAKEENRGLVIQEDIKYHEDTTAWEKMKVCRYEAETEVNIEDTGQVCTLEQVQGTLEESSYKQLQGRHVKEGDNQHSDEDEGEKTTGLQTMDENHEDMATKKGCKEQVQSWGEELQNKINEWLKEVNITSNVIVLFSGISTEIEARDGWKGTA